MSLVVALQVLPPFTPRAEASVQAPRWDLAARVFVTVAVVLLLTGFATTIGARLTGLLAVYPVYSAVLAMCARSVALGLLRGLVLGLFSFAAFYSVLAPLLVHVSTGAAFASAIAAGLVTQVTTLRTLRLQASRFEANHQGATTG